MTQIDSYSGNSEIAYAKINLALHVRERLISGYHDIETVFAFLDNGDIVSVQPGEGINLSITGPFANGLSDTDNLIMDAAHLLASQSDRKLDANLVLEKHLPIASGIGGGSADAAAALRLLNRFWKFDLSISELAQLSAPLGADVPACVHSQTCLGKGSGQDIRYLDSTALKKYVALLVNPLIPIATASVFRDWDGIDRGALVGNTPMEMALSGRNDLQLPAESHAPVIRDILMRLNETNPVVARMSGSGATCFALYESLGAAHSANDTMNSKLEKIWTMIGGIK
ncbi:4-(cytidine 5'-diphospho)-2-C-methyl-D-erythritol kinase [Parasphingorhabdus sp. JC815]|uniref:4-(cytidine 5'-diphospho)-2-C-methyl-D-erythritol kinase n=1 Tax=Parasphingorhabdus sp. JC815 TaxID=3232140 RepID=UPI00345A71AF